MSALRNERGMALLLVLVIVALLSALLVEFSFSTLVDLRATENFRDRTKAFYLARGGVEAARMILQQDSNSYDHPTELWGAPMVNIPAGDGEVDLEIRDLSGRFDLNSVANAAGQPVANYHRFVALCEQVLLVEPDEAERLATSLLDWLNPTADFVSADDGYYAAQQPVYQRKGGRLDVLEELQLVRSFDAATFARLKPFIRVGGDEKININTAPAEVLYAWQFPGEALEGPVIFELDEIEELLRYRAEAPFEDARDMGNVAGIGTHWITLWPRETVSVQGSLFQVESRGRVNQGSRVAHALIIKQGNRLTSLRVE